MQSPGNNPVKSASILLILLSLIRLFQSPIPRRFATSSLHMSGVNDAAQGIPPIPNIVHFIQLVRLDPISGTARFEFQFRQFVAVYSAWYYLKPEIIYVNTNFNESLIEDKIRKAKSPYTQAIAQMPNVKFRYHAAPNQTTDGQEIDKMAHRSDFVRTDVLQRFGSIYLDDGHVIGRQADGKVCNAVLIATPQEEEPQNEMMLAYHTLMDAVFDGGWETHSILLLTTLARKFGADSSQVLVLPQDSFFPLSCWRHDLEYFYGKHENTATAVINNKPTSNLEIFIANFKLWQDETWERDWRTSYLLHGWTSGIPQFFNEAEQLELFGQDQGIT
ncbi:hypothetical protein ABVK25_007645 [Lepraria finkii]|uniref:Uncharacterized protein n=1 Tax=Lepraria finkii TaxID=1340010 RepID=A0ABR4B465_9LECA